MKPLIQVSPMSALKCIYKFA